MPRVDEFTVDEFHRRYAGTFILNLHESNWIPAYVVSAVRDSSSRRTGLVTLQKAEDYNRITATHYCSLNEDFLNLSLPTLGYVNDNGGGYMSRNISRAYKRGLDPGTIIYQDYAKNYLTITGVAMKKLWMPEYPDIFTALDTKHKKTTMIGISKDFAVLHNPYYKLPILHYRGYEVGMINAKDNSILLKKQLDYLPEEYLPSMKGFRTVLV
jgi:hypothetical protein